MNSTEKLKQRLIYAKISQQSIADAIGVTIQFVNAVLNGRENSHKVTTQAYVMVMCAIQKKPALKALFESEGI